MTMAIDLGSSFFRPLGSDQDDNPDDADRQEAADAAAPDASPDEPAPVDRRTFDRMVEVSREDIAATQKMLGDLRDRLKAAILDVIEESGEGSPQHLRLRRALCGEG